MVLRNARTRVAELLIWGATCLGACVPAVASESLLTVMRSCAAQADESARLQCYDRAVAQFKGARGTDTACSDTGVSQQAVISKPPAITPATPAPGTHAEPGTNAQSGTNAQPGTNAGPGTNTEQFGLTSGQVLRKGSDDQRPPALKKITARIVTLSHRAGGAVVVHLDNGQIWEQTEEGPELHVAAGDPVTIDRGLLGAYWLSRDSGGTSRSRSSAFNKKQQESIRRCAQSAPTARRLENGAAGGHGSPARRQTRRRSAWARSTRSQPGKGQPAVRVRVPSAL